VEPRRGGSFALVVPLMREEIGLSSHQAGAALAAGALAGIAAAPILHRIERRWRGPDLYVLTIFASAPPMALLGLAGGFYGALLANVLVNLIDWIVMSVFIGERQRRAPDEMQARVGISGRMLMTASMTVGTAIASALTRRSRCGSCSSRWRSPRCSSACSRCRWCAGRRAGSPLPDARRIGRRNVVKRLQAIEGEPGRSVYAGGAATFERETRS
jgi:MFS family permease